MSSSNPPPGRHSTLRKLLALIGAGAIIGAAAPVQANISPEREALEARVDNVRAAIQDASYKEAPDQILAQWRNWGNWNNWNNWPNWGNWGNWLNR